MDSSEHCAKGQEGSDASAEAMTMPIRMAFSHFYGRSW